MHPQIDGKTNVTNQTLENSIQYICRERPKQCDLALLQVEFAYNSAVHNAIDMSPFALVYRPIPEDAVNLICLPTEHWVSVAVERMAIKVQDMQSEVEKKLAETNVKYKTNADKYQRSKIFEKGDSVMMFLPKEQFSAGTCSKLKSRKYDPYKVLR